LTRKNALFAGSDGGASYCPSGPSKSWGDCDASGMTGRQVRCRGIVDGTDFAAG
jgi:hypothetical protein